MKTILILCLLLALFACGHTRYTNISQINEYFDRQDMFFLRETVPNGTNVTYYFITHTMGANRYEGWYCWEYTCDKTGLILSTKEYWIGNDKALDEFKKHIKQP